MATSPPPELADLIEAGTPASAERAWSTFLQRHSKTILAAARCFAPDYDGQMDRYRHVLEELRRDDFGRLRRFHQNPRGRFQTWLLVVCRRLCIDYHRSRYGRDRGASKVTQETRARRRRLADLLMEELDAEGPRDTSGKNPEGELRTLELSEAVEAVLSELNPEDRLLLKLRFYDGLPVRNVALAMRYPTVFHVYRRLTPLLKSLREQLEKRGVDGPEP
jgi:RNA polymerase sigma factor (sigma-70 family)